MIQFAGGNDDKKRGGGRQRTGIPFLTREVLTTEKREMSILMVKSGQDNRGNAQVSLKVNIGGILYIWNLRNNNPNVKTFIEMFGNEETQWAGKKCLVANQEDEFSGTYWPTVFELKAKRG